MCFWQFSLSCSHLPSSLGKKKKKLACARTVNVIFAYPPKILNFPLDSIGKIYDKVYVFYVFIMQREHYILLHEQQ
jgi:hypothetical protein